MNTELERRVGVEYQITRWVCVVAASAVPFMAACDRPEAPPARQVPTISTTDVEVGGSDESGVLFGEIQDVAFLPPGDFLVLDRMNSVLTRFDIDGRVVSTVGSEGEGPGEWLWPSSVDVSSSGVVRVVSQGLSRIHEYEVRGEDLALVDEARLPFLPRDLCTLNDRVFVLGLYQGFTLHEVRGGVVISSFSPPIERPPELLGVWDAATAEWAADGRLACDEEHGLVIHAPFSLPDVRAFNASGQIVWQIKLEGWSQIRWERNPGAPIHAAPDPTTGRASTIVSVAVVSPTEVMVQMSNTSRPGYAGAEREIDSRIFEIGTGAPCGSSGELLSFPTSMTQVFQGA